MCFASCPTMSHVPFIVVRTVSRTEEKFAQYNTKSPVARSNNNRLEKGLEIAKRRMQALLLWNSP